MQIDIPADATVGPWSDDNGQPVRSFTGPSWNAAGIVVGIEGEQSLAGVTRRALVGDTPLSAGELAALIGVLQAALVAIGGDHA